MRNARLLQVPLTRDICIFCATRQVSDGAPSIRHRSVSQRRNFNNSGRVQDSAEAQAFRQSNDGQSAAERERDAIRARFASAAFAPSTHAPQTLPQNSGHSSQAERERAALRARFGSQQSRVSSQQGRSIPVRSLPTSAHRRSDHTGGNNASGRRATPSSDRQIFRVRMENQPLPSDAAEVDHKVVSNWPHLRRRNDPADIGNLDDFLRSMEKKQSEQLQARPQPAPQPAPQPEPRRKLDDDELAQLLGNATRHTRPEAGSTQHEYVPLSKNVEQRPRKCFRCGSQEHAPSECPQAPVRRFVATPRELAPLDYEPLQEGRNDRTPLATATPNVSETDERDAEAERRRAEAAERRMARFNATPTANYSTNRMDDPERRDSADRRKARPRRFVRDDDEEMDDIAERQERKRERKEAKRKAQLQKAAAPTPVYLPEYVSVANLASILKVRVEEFVKKLEQLGFEDVQNDHVLNAEHAGLIAMEYNFEPIVQTPEESEDLYPAPLSEDLTSLPARPPVVTIMGHVDHGKTTILDYLRKSSVAATEFGGITQHIGAFSVPLASGKMITFLDTPGHAAFLSMRQRGANVTDIVILVVAADDSVKPQTIEAIKHAQSANVPMIVAINKIDKEQAHADRVKQDLARHGVEVEDFGGETQVVCVSGKTGQGISELEEAVTTLSEILDHRADTEGAVEGWILEATTKKNGRVATVLVRRGTLRPGDVLVAGTTWTRVRTLCNEAGVTVDEVGPGMPVEVDGWREQPLAGDEVLQASDEHRASSVTEFRLDEEERRQMAKDMDAINESRRLEAERREAAEKAEKESYIAENDTWKTESGPEVVPFIVKADVSGSVEAVVDYMAPIGNGEIGCRVLRSGVGPPSEFDIQHAADAKGHIINFNTAVAPHIKALADTRGVKIFDSNIIYRVVEDVKALLSEKLPPKIVTRVTGEAEIAQVFEIGLGGKKKMKVAGTKVRNGVIGRNDKVKVLRGQKVVYNGTFSSLKNQKKDVEQMRKDTECGLGFAEWEDFKVGDKIQSYLESQEKRSL